MYRSQGSVAARSPRDNMVEKLQSKQDLVSCGWLEHNDKVKMTKRVGLAFYFFIYFLDYEYR